MENVVENENKVSFVRILYFTFLFYPMALQQEFESQGNILFRYRSNIPLILIPFALIVIYYSLQTQPNWFSNDDLTLLEIAAVVVCMLGLIIRIYTVGHTPKNTSGRNTAEGQVADVLNTTGIYSTVRHPLYLGNFFMWLGIAFLTANIWFVIAFIFAYWVYYERIMYAEEQFLTRKFGEQYLTWAASTPAFVPDLSKFNSSNLGFSWKKVLKKEKNGLFAVFLVIYLLNCWISYLTIGQYYSDKSWSLWAMILSGVLYFVLKFLKSSTKVLDEEGR